MNRISAKFAALLCAAIGLPFIAAAQLSPELTNGLVLWLPFNGSAADSSGAGNNGNPVGITYTNDQAGTVGGAAHFAGSSSNYVVVPDNASLHNPYLTFACWIRTAITNRVMQIVAKAHYGTSADEQWTAYIDTLNYPKPTLVFGIKRNSSGVSQRGWNFVPYGPLTLTNQWLFIAGEWDGKVESLYLNAELVARNTNVLAGGIDDVGLMGDIQIGRSTLAGYPYQGDIDQMRVYNRALPTNELAALYNLGSPPSIAAQPQSQTVAGGGDAVFDVAAAGVGPFSYQWSFNGVTIDGETNSELVLHGVGLTQAGLYQATVCNVVGCTQSVPATLAIPELLPPNLTNGLVASLLLDGNAVDSSGLGNSGQAVGVGYTVDQFGASNAAAFFNHSSSSYIVIPDSQSLHSPNLALACWVRTPVNNQVMQIATKARYGDSAGEQWTLFIDTLNYPKPTLVFGVKRNGDGHSELGWRFLPYGPLSLTNQWMFLSATWDGVTQNLFIDAKLVASTTNVPPGGIDDVPLISDIQIGRSTIPAYAFEGEIDRFKVYDRALSSDEIRQLYSIEGPPPPPVSAKALARVDGGFLVEIDVTDSGIGYTNTPQIEIIGGGGSGAAVEVEMSFGIVTGIQITNPGKGYTNAPLILIEPPVAEGADALAVISGGSVAGIQLTGTGSGYTDLPTVSLIGGGGVGAKAVVVLTNGVVETIRVVDPGTGYTNVPIVRIDPPTVAAIPATSLKLAIKSVEITMSVVSQRVYALESSIDLINWNQVGSEFVAQSDSVVQDVDVQSADTFFRLRDVTRIP